MKEDWLLLQPETNKQPENPLSSQTARIGKLSNRGKVDRSGISQLWACRAIKSLMRVARYLLRNQINQRDLPSLPLVIVDSPAPEGIPSVFHQSQAIQCD